MKGERCFKKLLFWHDDVPRLGAENMAVDECLLMAAQGVPVLRIYEWAEPTVSFGYFDKEADARRVFAEEGEGVSFLRRATGGGIVDHRVDVTYSLVIPRGHPLTEGRSGESYALIHRAVALALKAEGVPAVLIEEDSSSENRSCFKRPVAWDIVDSTGKKLAGAGQRRSRTGLLHQGSVQGITLADLVQSLPSSLAETVEDWTPGGELAQREEIVAQKYGNDSWLRRR